ncbi:MAG: hypothetical protein AB9891_08810 [Anaerolineaceae bacterium]
MESDGNDNDRRQHFRLIYPSEFAPGLIINGRLFIVQDICERAIRFRRDASRRYESGQRITATLLFNDGSKFEVIGWVGRIYSYDVVVMLTKYIPYQKIIAEQVNIGKKKAVS